MTVSEKTRMPHGYSRYTKGCRCEACRQAKREYTKERRRRSYLADATGPADSFRHGRFGYEERGCRCEVCVTARRAMWVADSRKRRAKADAS